MLADNLVFNDIVDVYYNNKLIIEVAATANQNDSVSISLVFYGLNGYTLECNIIDLYEKIDNNSLGMIFMGYYPGRTWAQDPDDLIYKEALKLLDFNRDRLLTEAFL